MNLIIEQVHVACYIHMLTIQTIWYNLTIQTSWYNIQMNVLLVGEIKMEFIAGLYMAPVSVPST